MVMLAIENLRNTVRQALKSVINLHIEILILEANVNQLIAELKEINDDLMEIHRLDKLISTLRDYNGPIICHEWPYPQLIETPIDKADIVHTSLSSSSTSSNSLENLQL